MDIVEYNPLLDKEEKCKEKDSRIVAVSNCFYEESDSKYHIINSKGLDIVKYNRYCIAGVGVVARDNGDTQNAYQFSAKKSFEEIDIEEISSKAVEKAVAKFNAKPVKTDKYKVIRGGNISFKNIPVYGSKKIENACMLFKKYNKER